MTVRFKKRARKFRGSQHHGWGKQKGHKKSGIRGGVGKAGPKTRHKMLVILGRRKPIGKHGFTKPPSTVKKDKVINVSQVSAMIPKLLNDGLAEKKGDKVIVDLNKLGYTKLLAQGQATVPIEVTVKKASERAIEKIEQAGGKVILPN